MLIFNFIFTADFVRIEMIASFALQEFLKIHDEILVNELNGKYVRFSACAVKSLSH